MPEYKTSYMGTTIGLVSLRRDLDHILSGLCKLLVGVDMADDWDDLAELLFIVSQILREKHEAKIRELEKEGPE